jgi:hypothetical protein
MGVVFDQRIEEQHIDAGGLGIGSDAGIEVGGAALNQHDYGVCWRFRLAASSQCERGEREQAEECTAAPRERLLLKPAKAAAISHA